jgi:hypothetical protein
VCGSRSFGADLLHVLLHFLQDQKVFVKKKAQKVLVIERKLLDECAA